MNPWPLVCPLTPQWPWKQEFQLTHHRSALFSSRFVFLTLVAKRRLGVARAWQPPARSPPLFSSPLSPLPFSHSSVWASPFCLLFCLIELFGRRACQTTPSMWGVWGPQRRPSLCSQRRVSFSPLVLHEWAWPRSGLGGAGIKCMTYQQAASLFCFFPSLF